MDLIETYYGEFQLMFGENMIWRFLLANVGIISFLLTWFWLRFAKRPSLDTVCLRHQQYRQTCNQTKWQPSMAIDVTICNWRFLVANVGDLYLTT